MGGCFVSSVTACTKGPAGAPDPLVHHGEGAKGRRCHPPQISRRRLAAILGGLAAAGRRPVWCARARARARARTDRQGRPPPPLAGPGRCIWHDTGRRVAPTPPTRSRITRRTRPDSARAVAPHFCRRPSWATDSSPDSGAATVAALYPRPPQPPPPPRPDPSRAHGRPPPPPRRAAAGVATRPRTPLTAVTAAAAARAIAAPPPPTQTARRPARRRAAVRDAVRLHTTLRP